MQTPRVLFLGEVAYADSYAWMQDFTHLRLREEADEFWVLNHPPVYTQGLSCQAAPSAEHAHISLAKTDRGGQITYHGPGQIIVYLLLDIKRLGIGPKRLVQVIERGVIALLAQYDLQAKLRAGAPGVYVGDAKVAALGLKIRHGKTYHGLSLNVDMDLAPFSSIDPCGYEGLKVTQLRDLGVKVSIKDVQNQLVDCLIESIYAPIEAD